MLFRSEIAKPADFNDAVRDRALELARNSDRPAETNGITLPPVNCQVEQSALHYEHLSIALDREKRTATFVLKGPAEPIAADLKSIKAQGASWFPLAFARQLEDAILSMRTNELSIGTWIIKSQGKLEDVLHMDEVLEANKNNWLVRETIGYLRRTMSRLDVSSRSLFALIEEGSCFAGTFLEAALACDRIYQLALPETPERAPQIALSPLNFGDYPMATGQSRLSRRFYEDSEPLSRARTQIGKALDANAAVEIGLITSNPDDIDWDDEVRIAIEERVAMSPDALTGLEANLRFNGQENMLTRIFSRLTAWQNWIFQRPNAVGEKGALKVYGTGNKAVFDWDRV